MGYRVEREGKYKQLNGLQMTVTSIDSAYVYGIDSDGDVTHWHRETGARLSRGESGYDIVGEWDGPEPVNPEHQPAPLSLRDEIGLRILCAMFSNPEYLGMTGEDSTPYALKCADDFLAARDAHNAKSQEGR